jgi:hypothetical protein
MYFVQSVKQLREIMIEAGLFRHVHRGAGGIETEKNPLRLDFIAGAAHSLEKVEIALLAAWLKKQALNKPGAGPLSSAQADQSLNKPSVDANEAVLFVD